MSGVPRLRPFRLVVDARGRPAVLAEISFITPADEGRHLAAGAYLDALAEGLLHGIRGFAKSSHIAATL